jgi:uncharacterized protein
MRGPGDVSLAGASLLAAIGLGEAVIVDTHTHIGMSHSTGVLATPGSLTSAMRNYGMAACMVMPQPTDPRAPQLHDEIHLLAGQLPGQVFGIALIDPRLPEREYAAHAERLLADYRFVALKLHTFGHEVAPDDDQCTKVFLAARRFGKPVMIHTGLGGPHTLPERARPVAERFADVPIVLCHAGFGAFWQQAVDVAEAWGNVVLEPSWSPGFAIGQMISRVGAHRVLFGSDHASNIPAELVKLAALNLPPQQLAAVLAGNAIRLFGLELAPRVSGSLQQAAMSAARREAGRRRPGSGPGMRSVT